MKKLIMVFAAMALIASPALAVDWNFYGNARMATFYTSRDLGDALNTPGGENEDSDLQWALQGNSRVGATVKAESISGRFELGLGGDGTQWSGDGGDASAGTRRIEATWDFGAGKLLVGKTYGPVNQFLSGQVFAGDAGLLGRGFLYGGRPGMIQLSFGGFKVALISNKTNTISVTTGEVDTYLPKIEAAFGMSMDAFNFNIMGGYQTYEISDTVNGDVDVDSYVIGADAGFSFGPGYIKCAASYGENWADARWSAQNDLGAVLVAGSSNTDDTTVWQAGIVGGFKFTDMVSFEAGFGYINIDPDAPAPADEEASWEAYGQAVIQLAPGVFVIPEVGYIDNGDSPSDGSDAGNTFYLGGKWQINF
jgi:hypothetical protein